MIDAHEQAASFAAVHRLVYDPVKKIKGEKWEKGADRKERRHFRDLLIALQTSLDALSDVIAIFYPGCIRGLEVGRAQFSRVESWLRKSRPIAGLIATPSDFYLQKLHDVLAPVVNAKGPEVDWLPMMRLLRNKAAHLGQPLFRQVGLPRAGDGKLFVFIPRQWPYLWERLIKPAGQGPIEPFPELLKESLVHQDFVTYSRGLLLKVQELVGVACEVLNEAYEQFKDFPENEAALIQLKGNFEQYKFESFENV